MKTEIENVSDVKKIIHFEIPWDEVDKHIKQTVRQISRSARIPGFRPGKAPENIIRSRYAEHIKEDVIQHLVPEAYKEALQENQFDLVSEPALHDVMYSEGSPFIFKVTIETRPNIDVQNYDKLKLKAETVQVTDEEVDLVLKKYQDRAAELIPLEGKAAETGDFVHAKVKATIDRAGKKQNLFDDRTLIALGSEEKHPAFNENLHGKKAGETIEFDAVYAEDHQEKALAGKTIHYTVHLENVNERRIAPLDDEFAKDLGDFQSLQDLKDKIRKDVEKAKTSEQRSILKDQVLKQVIDSNPFEAPEGLIKRETEALLRSYAHSLQRRGIDLESKEIDWKELQSRLAHQADHNVRGTILMEAIARKENIEVNAEDVDGAIAEIADQQRRAPEAVKAEIVKE
ncbi:MAG TPA: trigger factor, partial [Acidobacteriota bacterium]|nr:trigger factor [Acidobacteriota bacterium]